MLLACTSRLQAALQPGAKQIVQHVSEKMKKKAALLFSITKKVTFAPQSQSDGLG
jgi:hypothetical protein